MLTENDANLMSQMSSQGFAAIADSVRTASVMWSEKRKLRAKEEALRVRDSIERLFDVDTTVLSDGFIQRIEYRLSDLLMQMQQMLMLQPEMFTQVRESVLQRGEFPQSLDPLLIERIRDEIKAWLQEAADEKQHQLSVTYRLVGLQHAGYVNTPMLVSSDDGDPLTYRKLPGANIWDLEEVIVGPEIDGVDSKAAARETFMNPAAWSVEVSGGVFYSNLPRSGSRVVTREGRIGSFGIDKYDYQYGFAVVALVSAKGKVKAAVACDTEELLTVCTRRFDAIVEAGDGVKLVSRLFSRLGDARDYAGDLLGRKGKRGELTTDPSKVLGGVR